MKPGILRTAACVLLLLAPAGAHAELEIDITRGVSDPVPVAVVPFAHAAASDGAPDVAAVVEHDLASSGRFKGLPRAAMPAQPQRAADVNAAAWHAAHADYVVVGRVAAGDGGTQVLHFDLVNALTGQRLLNDESVTVPQKSWRRGAHRIADRIFEKITGVRGAFDTRIAYVAVDGTPPSQHFQLIVADADGENAAVAARGSQPIMSPAWSPDGEWLAYVSFEKGVSVVNVQRLSTGELRQVSARAGVNGAPAFSPDGRRLALTLSGTAGDTDVYVLDLATQQLTRITDDPAIDTEPAWSPDGQMLYFTSDRGGAPQIYVAAPTAKARARRISFGVAYAARPRVSPDGKQLALVEEEGGASYIATLDLASGNITTLSHGNLDESPSFAPNGAMLIYAGRDGGRGVLATVSVDGQVSSRLKSAQGEVREPVWGPFTN
ncbi:MAG TPA: Tol-Pal system beta propeller repeat protein TolB [Steroidobacteraceae bacterium]|nr:Tol-Pal system beta propeller repeat protein TolB [Steroidobacteraceae bacterium]